VRCVEGAAESALPAACCRSAVLTRHRSHTKAAMAIAATMSLVYSLIFTAFGYVVPGYQTFKAIELKVRCCTTSALVHDALDATSMRCFLCSFLHTYCREFPASD
jgi:hypothetical protein